MAELVSEDNPQTFPAFKAGDVILSCEPWVWSFQYKYHKILCAHCFVRSDNLRACSNCHLYRYCGTQCQVADWKKEHKRECDMLKEIQTNIVNHGWDFDHDCVSKMCRQFGCCTLEILLAKVINKITRGDKDKLAGYSGKMSAEDVLKLFPCDEAYHDVFVKDLHNIQLTDPGATLDSLCAFWPPAVMSIPEFPELAKKVYFNAFPIKEQNRKLVIHAAGLFPQAVYRNMTAVCWDINVSMDFQGRTLVVHAMENIPTYTGPKDLRQNELIAHAFSQPLKRRREEFQLRYFHPCTCRKCTDGYEAEINPLKCSTPACMERIPSDDRALETCPQCGALNSHRLYKLKHLTKEYEKCWDDLYLKVDGRKSMAQLNHLFREMENASLLHKDAHLRFACGYNAVMSSVGTGRYAEAWNNYRDIVACVRAIYPKYHLSRADMLMKGPTEIPSAWYPHLRKDQRKEYFERVLPEAREFLLEAQTIYRVISGDNCQWVQYIEELLQKLLQTHRVC